MMLDAIRVATNHGGFLHCDIKPYHFLLTFSRMEIQLFTVVQAGLGGNRGYFLVKLKNSGVLFFIETFMLMVRKL
ncbi:hypothetical protein Hdeb2414_s0006g00205991 [Helianthus debilis subsp. tardiflorus]